MKNPKQPFLHHFTTQKERIKVAEEGDANGGTQNTILYIMIKASL